MSSSSSIEQGQLAAEGTATQDSLTADGVQIAQVQPGDMVYAKIADDNGGVFQLYKVIQLGSDEVEVWNVGAKINIAISPKLILTTCPKTGRVLETPEDYSQYALFQSMKFGEQLAGVSTKTRGGIQTLLELDFLKIDPVKLFESLTIESPGIENMGTLEEGQQVFIHCEEGAYLSGSFISIDHGCGRINVKLSDGPTRIPVQQCVHKHLPEGKRACKTLKQIDIFKSYLGNINSAAFARMSPAQQGLILAGLAQAFLEE